MQKKVGGNDWRHSNDFRPINLEDYRYMSTPSASAIPEPDPSISQRILHVLVYRNTMPGEPKTQARKSAQQIE